MADRTIAVTVVYAEAGWHILRRLELAGGSTVMQAIDASGIAAILPDTIDARHLSIFAHRVQPDQAVQEGDRIEICRPLLLDPMEARRRRVR